MTSHRPISVIMADLVEMESAVRFAYFKHKAGSTYVLNYHLYDRPVHFVYELAKIKSELDAAVEDMPSASFMDAEPS